MKKNIILFLLSFCFTTYSQNEADIDPSFYTEGLSAKLSGFSGQVNDFAKQLNGKLIVVGGFSSYNNINKNSILRLNSDGSLDNSFNCLGQLNNINTVVVQNDGKIIVGGTFTNFQFSTISTKRIVRLNSDGTRDTSFSVGTGFNNEVTKIILQSDGKLIVSGLFTQYRDVTANRLVRINTDGSIDNTFTTGTGLNTKANTIIQQQDGKLLLGGNFFNYNGVSKLRILRLNHDGSIDNSFNVNESGFISNYNTDIKCLLELQNGQILISGNNFISYNDVLVKEIIRINNDGTLDNTFNTGLGFTNNSCSSIFSTVSDLKELSGGQLLICGNNFTAYNDNIASSIIRLNQDGSFDSTYASIFPIVMCNGSSKIILDENEDAFLFTNGGIHPEGFFKLQLIKLFSNGKLDRRFNPGKGFYGDPKVIKLQTDGKVIVGGEFDRYNDYSVDRLIRLDQQGNVDLTFNIGSGFNDVVTEILIQTDNKIIVGGQFTTFNNINVNRIVRLNIDGSIDTSFNTGNGFNGIVNSIQLQSDGKLVIGGGFTTFNNTTSRNIVRLNVNGTLDTSFNIGLGFSSIASPPTSSSVNTVFIQNDGKIFVGGNFLYYNGITSKKMIKLNTNGTVDSSFFIGDLFDIGSIAEIKQQSDGKLIVGKAELSVSALFRLNTNGSLDSTFNGVLVNNGNDPPEINVQADGTILIGGFFTFNNVNTTDLIRITANGTFINQYQVGWTSDYTILPDGKIIAVGLFTSSTSTPLNRISKLNTDYSIDSLFNTEVGFDNDVNAIELQNGKSIIGGNFTKYNGNSANKLIRLNDNATRDYSFNIGFGFDNRVNAIAKQTDNKIVVGGDFITYNSINSNKIIRLNEDGTVDINFNIGQGFNDKINSIYIQSDGKILVGGNFTSYNSILKNYLVRLNNNGSIDYSFINDLGPNNSVKSIIVDSNNRIIVGGTFTTFNSVSVNRLIRLNADGTIDQTFNIGIGFDNEVTTLQKKLDNKIYVAGNFTSYNNSNYNRIVRLNEDGSIDDSFNTGSGFNAEVKKLSIDLSDKILVGGDFTILNGNSKNKIARLNTDGSNDNLFEPNEGFNSIVNAISILPNNKVLVGGSYNLYRATTANRIVRLTGGYNSLLHNQTPLFEEKNNLILYPNPVENILFYIGEKSGLKTISIYDLTGKLVASPQVEFESINIENLVNGIYFISFHYEQYVIVKRILKQ